MQLLANHGWHILASFTLVFASTLTVFAFVFLAAAHELPIILRFGASAGLLCITAAIAYGSLTVLVGGAP